MTISWKSPIRSRIHFHKPARPSVAMILNTSTACSILTITGSPTWETNRPRMLAQVRPKMERARVRMPFRSKVSGSFDAGAGERTQQPVRQHLLQVLADVGDELGQAGLDHAH